MTHVGVGTPADDGRVGVSACTVQVEMVFSGSIQLILIHTGRGGPHRFHDAKACDLCCLADQGNFSRAFDGTHTIYQRTEVMQSKLRKAFLDFLDERGFFRGLTIPGIRSITGLSGEYLVSAIIPGFGRTELCKQFWCRWSDEAGADEVHR